MTSEALKSSACGSSGPRRLCPQRHTWAAAAAAGPTARRGAMLPLVNVCACLGGARGGRRESLPAARSSDACTARQRRQRAQEDPNQGHSAGRRLVVSGYGGLRTGPTAKPRRWPQCGARARAHGAGEAQDGGAVQKRRPGRPRRLCSSGTNLTNHDAAALGAQGRAATRERKATLLRAEGPARGPRRPLGKFACEGPSAAASWGSKRHRYRRV
ncbi:unnamed protein product [Prorocentrum cordatum]|uniref:Uncharacterized protein n=1 Tax=Prorocentrum cordatum TaxID=2364126 RepID=A0ABN9XFW0_9DINO|nr:unnamed protein product [Polarella glacialis]